MIRRIFTLLLLGFLLATAPYYSFAQQGNTTLKIEALKNLSPIDPFKMSPQAGASFDPQKGESLYFEDGKKISFEQFSSYISRTEKDYIVIPYVNPADKEKVVAMLVRKATPEEMEQMKGLLAAQAESKKMYASEAGDPTDPSSMAAIKFDPSLKAKDYIKGLKKMKEGGSVAMNLGRIALFDEKGNLIPLATGGAEVFKKVQKYMRSPEFAGDTYIDEDEVIRAIVFRAATMEERKRKADMAGSIIEATVKGEGDGGATSGESSSASSKLETGVKLPAGATSGSLPGGTFTGENYKKKFGVGSKAKTFKAVDMDGNTVDLAALEGKKTVVLNFWFTACKPCVAEMPELNKMVDEMKGKDVEFISICNDGKEEVKEFLTKIKYDYRCIPDGLAIANQYQVIAFPTHVVINKKGEIVLLEQGFSNNLIPKIKEIIKKDQK